MAAEVVVVVVVVVPPVQVALPSWPLESRP